MFTACGIINRRCCRLVTSSRSSAPEDGRNYRPKHVELIGIINKPLLVHLVGVYIIVSMMHGHTDIKWNRQCSETSAYTIQTLGNYPEESMQHSE